MRDGISSGIKWAGIVLILLTGLIHLVEGPEYIEEAGPIIGGSFFLNAAGAALAAFGILKGAKTWGWTLGAVVAAGAFIVYILSRTVGLFGFYEGEFFESLGIVSMVVEAIYLALYFRAIFARN